MNKIAKISLRVFIALFLLALLTLFALGYFFNPERLKPLAVDYVKEHYNRTLEVGNVRWKLFPRLGISLSDVALSNNPTFGDGVFASMNSATVFVKTMSLLGGKVDVTTLELNGAKANLQTNNAGVNSWDDLVQAPNGQAQTTKTSADAPVAAEKTEDVSGFEFNIQSIEIVDGAFTYEDKKTGEKYDISDFNFSSKNVALNQDFPVDLKFKVASNAPELKATIQAKATMQVAAKNNEYDLSAITLNGDISMPDLSASGLKITQFKSPVKVENSVINLSGISAQLYGGTLGGDVVLDATKQPASVKVKYDIRNADIGPLMRALDVNQSFTGRLNMAGNLSFRGYPDDKQLTQSLNGTANVNIDKGTLHGVDLAFWYAVGNNMLSGTVLGTGEAVAGRSDQGRTDFIDARASFNIKNGVLSNNDLILYNTGVYGAGAGTVNLVSDRINYRFKIQGVKRAGDKYQPAGQVVPLQITGSTSNPNISLDMEIVKEKVIEGIGREIFKAIGR